MPALLLVSVAPASRYEGSVPLVESLGPLLPEWKQPGREMPWPGIQLGMKSLRNKGTIIGGSSASNQKGYGTTEAKQNSSSPYGKLAWPPMRHADKRNDPPRTWLILSFSCMASNSACPLNSVHMEMGPIGLGMTARKVLSCYTNHGA